MIVVSNALPSAVLWVNDILFSKSENSFATFLVEPTLLQSKINKFLYLQCLILEITFCRIMLGTLSLGN